MHKHIIQISLCLSVHVKLQLICFYCAAVDNYFAVRQNYIRRFSLVNTSFSLTAVFFVSNDHQTVTLQL